MLLNHPRLRCPSCGHVFVLFTWEVGEVAKCAACSCSVASLVPLSGSAEVFRKYKVFYADANSEGPDKWCYSVGSSDFDADGRRIDWTKDSILWTRRTRSKKWYGNYVDTAGALVQVELSTDKAESQRMLDELRPKAECEPSRNASQAADNPWTWIVVALLILGGLVAHSILTRNDPANRGPYEDPADDPYYDAPRGRTRGGDDY